MSSDLQGAFDTLFELLRQKRSKEQITLGELVHVLSSDDYKKIRVDDGKMGILDVSSYRGYYHDLALEPAYLGDGEKSLTPKEVLGKLSYALEPHVTFEGYKGGKYKMGEDTPLWVSDWGYDSGRAVRSLQWSGDTLILITGSEG